MASLGRISQAATSLLEGQRSCRELARIQFQEFGCNLFFNSNWTRFQRRVNEMGVFPYRWFFDKSSFYFMILWWKSILFLVSLLYMLREIQHKLYTNTFCFVVSAYLGETERERESLRESDGAREIFLFFYFF